MHFINIGLTFVLIDSFKEKEDKQSRASLGRTHFFPAITAQGSGTGLAPEISIARQTARERQKGRMPTVTVVVNRMGSRHHDYRTPGNGREGLGRIRTDFVEILKKGQEPIRTKFHIFLKQPDPLSGQKSKFQDKRGNFISDRANPGKKICKK